MLFTYSPILPPVQHAFQQRLLLHKHCKVLSGSIFSSMLPGCQWKGHVNSGAIQWANCFSRRLPASTMLFFFAVGGEKVFIISINVVDHHSSNLSWPPAFLHSLKFTLISEKSKKILLLLVHFMNYFLLKSDTTYVGADFVATKGQRGTHNNLLCGLSPHRAGHPHACRPPCCPWLGREHTCLLEQPDALHKGQPRGSARAASRQSSKDAGEQHLRAPTPLLQARLLLSALPRRR